MSYPAWESNLSGSVLRHARQTDYDTEYGINRTLGYKFFSKEVNCVVIFELLQYHSEWLADGRVDLSALMNAILEYWPEYALSFNAHEQAGLNDGAGLFLRSMGIEVELNGSVDRMITLTPGAGINFLRWQQVKPGRDSTLSGLIFLGGVGFCVGFLKNQLFGIITNPL